MKLKGEKILVTGGAGFIGSHLCDRFIAEGAEVVCLDNLSTGFKQNIQQLIGHERFTFVQGDVRDLETCHRAIEGCTLVSHQAALGSVPRSIKHPEQTMSVNVQGFVNICSASVAAGVKRLVYASSSSVYGDNSELPKVEERIGKALSPYALSKQINEAYAQQCQDHYGLSTVGLRYFNVFGPRQNPKGDYAAVIPKFIQKAMNGQNLVINGDGSYSRDFTYIENIVNLNVLVLTGQTNSVEAPVYNGACGKATTIDDLARIILEQFNDDHVADNNSKINYAPVRPGDVPHSLASIERANKNLGYAVRMDLEQGIKLTIESFHERVKTTL
jgi:UDP-N-acetylglucosamine/UDP-N-acetylgalactosamine 4-epimerase